MTWLLLPTTSTAVWHPWRPCMERTVLLCMLADPLRTWQQHSSTFFALVTGSLTQMCPPPLLCLRGPSLHPRPTTHTCRMLHPTRLLKFFSHCLAQSGLPGSSRAPTALLPRSSTAQTVLRFCFVFKLRFACYGDCLPTQHDTMSNLARLITHPLAIFIRHAAWYVLLDLVHARALVRVVLWCWRK